MQVTSEVNLKPLNPDDAELQRVSDFRRADRPNAVVTDKKLNEIKPYNSGTEIALYRVSHDI